MSLVPPTFTLHAEADTRGSVCIVARSAFAALGAYRRLRRAHWPVVLITGENGRLTDEAALLRAISRPCGPGAAQPQTQAAAVV